jgi:hypothetical protein
LIPFAHGAVAAIDHKNFGSLIAAQNSIREYKGLNSSSSKRNVLIFDTVCANNECGQVKANH